MEVHICPVKMKTVLFDEGRCTEECREKECPIILMQKQEKKK